MIINYELEEEAFKPIRAHKADAGWDIRTPVPFCVRPRGSAAVSTGVHIGIPEGYVGFVKSKSGLNVKHGLRCEGVIDAGYTGSIVVNMYNDRDEFYMFGRGDKICQLVILPIPDIEMEEGKISNNTERGANGFGSSGR